MATQLQVVLIWVDVDSYLFYQRHYPFVAIVVTHSKWCCLCTHIDIFHIPFVRNDGHLIQPRGQFCIPLNHKDLGKYPVSRRPIRPPILAKKNGIRDNDVRDAGKKMEAKMEREFGIRTPLPDPLGTEHRHFR